MQELSIRTAGEAPCARFYQAETAPVVGTAKHPESLCLMLALPPSARRVPSPPRTLLPGLCSYGLIRQCAICTAVEKDCLTKGGEPIRPCVPSHVAYASELQALENACLT